MRVVKIILYQISFEQNLKLIYSDCTTFHEQDKILSRVTNKIKFGHKKVILCLRPFGIIDFADDRYWFIARAKMVKITAGIYSQMQDSADI